MRTALAVLVLFLVSTGTAAACSCAGIGDPREAVASADAAVYGEVVGRRDLPRLKVEYRLRVAGDYKDNVGGQVRIRTMRGGASCGLELRRGMQLGLLLYREGGRFESSLCSQISRRQLEASLAPPPVADGTGAARYLVAGGFGAAAVALLDADGRLLRLGPDEDDDVLDVAACPGTAAVVEARTDNRVTVRAVDTLAAREVLRATGDEIVGDVGCASGDRAAAYLFDGRRGGTGRVVLDGQTVWSGRSVRGTFHGSTVYLAVPKGLRRLDVETGESTLVPGVPRRASVESVSPDGTRLAVVRIRDGELLSVDAATGRLLGREADAKDPRWVTNSRVAASTTDDGRYRLLDERLRPAGPRFGAFGPLAGTGPDTFVHVQRGTLRAFDGAGRRQSSTPLFTERITSIVPLMAQSESFDRVVRLVDGAWQAATYDCRGKPTKETDHVQEASTRNRPGRHRGAPRRSRR